MRLRSSSPFATTPPQSAYPTFAIVKLVPVPQVDAVRLGWTRADSQPVSRRQPLTCTDVRSGLLSLSRAGRIRTGDPLTPQEHALCATCENSHNRAQNLRSRRSFRVICANPCHHHVPNVSPRVPEDRWVPMVTQRQTHSPPGVRCYPVRPHRRATLARWSPSSCSYRTAPASKSCQPVADGASVPCSVGDRVIRP